MTLSITGSGVLTGLSDNMVKAYRATNQSISINTFTKVSLDTKINDVGVLFNTTTNRFQPNIAGYYLVSAAVGFTTTPTNELCAIYRNGGLEIQGNQGACSRAVVCGIVAMNGSSDYIELFAYSGMATPIIQGGSAATYFHATLLQKA